jgi:hypothetical protein
VGMPWTLRPSAMVLRLTAPARSALMVGAMVIARGPPRTPVARGPPVRYAGAGR